MVNQIALLFGVHAHQPAGNFAEVIDHAHERCYRPFLRTLAEYPAFKFAMHVSGPLLDTLSARYPDDVELLEQMVARGQVELFGAGVTEPVLAAIPDRDRTSQLEALSAKLALRFGKVPHGAWLTERVWESSVVPALARAGFRYATVDDYHFLCTGGDAGDLDRYYTTEEDGLTLDVFPISETLRYRIPFSAADDAVRCVEALARDGPQRAAIYFDDIEKLGVWPETYAWVHERRWLRDFVERVLASSAIRSMHFGDFHRATRTGGIVYLPSTSYIEMNAWTLPAAAAAAYASVVESEKRLDRYAATKAFVRGGIWRNFLTRYPEANWMHKRMLGLSQRLADTADAADDGELRMLLHRAQANDGYWHGLFGGLYLPHLRRGIYASLIELEARLDAIDPRPASQRADVDFDGVDEIFIRTSSVQIAVPLDGTASIRELDSYALRQNFGDTLRRHREHYQRDRGDAAGDLAPDDTPRGIARDVWVMNGHVRPIATYELDAFDDSSASFGASVDAISVRKRISIGESTVVVRYDVESASAGTLRTTLDFAMPSCDGFAGRYVVGEGIPCGFGQKLDLHACDALALDDRCLGGALELRFAPSARVSAQPYHTLSQSEEGYERLMQSATLDVEWRIESPSATIELRMTISPD